MSSRSLVDLLWGVDCGNGPPVEERCSEELRSGERGSSSEDRGSGEDREAAGEPCGKTDLRRGIIG